MPMVSPKLVTHTDIELNHFATTIILTQMKDILIQIHFNCNRISKIQNVLMS